MIALLYALGACIFAYAAFRQGRKYFQTLQNVDCSPDGFDIYREHAKLLIYVFIATACAAVSAAVALS